MLNSWWKGLGLLTAMLVLVGALSLAGCARSEGTDATRPTTTGLPSTTTTLIEPEALGQGATGYAETYLANVPSSKLTGNFTRCGDCHSELDLHAWRNPALTKAFSHALHLSKGAACGDCHYSPTHTPQEVRKPGMEKCFKCHSLSATAPSGRCSTCHPPGFSLIPASHADKDWLPPAERLDSVKAKHSIEALKDKKACDLCHQQQFCLDCHKVDMPHPKDWLTIHPLRARQVQFTSCLHCHPKSESCSACHHKGFKIGGTPWRRLHPTVVATQGGVGPCLGCHSTVTCAHCHVTGQYQEYQRPSTSATTSAGVPDATSSPQ